MVKRDGYYAVGFRFDSHPSSLSFCSFFLYFFSGLGVTFMGWCEVRDRIVFG